MTMPHATPTRLFSVGLIVDCLLPFRCASCRLPLTTARDTGPASGPAHRLCRACYQSLVGKSSANRCSVCSIPLPQLVTRCARCTRVQFGFDSAFAAAAHADTAAALIRAYKSGRDRTLGAQMACHMIGTARAAGWKPISEASTVIPIPSSRRACRKRGFAGAAVLARHICSRLDLPSRSVLRLAGATPQKSLSLEERTAHARAALSLTGASAEVPDRVLLIDDVMTTGATVSHAASLLKEAGASRVDVLVFAMEH